MKYEETKIQKAIVQYLQLQKVFCFHIPNERKTSAQAMMRLISIGLRPGAPDLELWIPRPGVDRVKLYLAMGTGTEYSGPYPADGKLVDVAYIEVKKPGGRQSDNQKKFETRCRIAEIDYFLAYSVDDVEMILKKFL